MDEDVLLVTILQRALVENPIRVQNLNLHPVLIVQENTHLKVWNLKKKLFMIFLPKKEISWNVEYTSFLFLGHANQMRRQSTTEEILIARGFRRESTTEDMQRCRNFRRQTEVCNCYTYLSFEIFNLTN